MIPKTIRRVWRLLIRMLKPPRQLRLTKEGTRFVLLSLAIGFAAVNTGNNLLYLVMAMMLGLIVLSGILSESSFRKISVERLPPPHIFAGVPMEVRLRVENRKRHLPSLSLNFRDITERGPLEGVCYLLKVEARRRSMASYRVTFPSRGVEHFLGFSVSTAYPFGLFRKSMHLPLPGDLLIYPRLINPGSELSPASYDLGTVPSFTKGHGSDFYGLRDYNEGEDLRLVHWKTSARVGRLTIREWERECLSQITLIMDNRAPISGDSDYSERFEKAISLCASWAALALKEGFGVRLLTFSGATEWGTGPDHLWGILEELALLQVATEALFLPDDGSPGPVVYFQPAEVAPAIPFSLLYGPREIDQASMEPAFEPL